MVGRRSRALSSADFSLEPQFGGKWGTTSHASCSEMWNAKSLFGCWEHMHYSASDDDTQRTMAHIVCVMIVTANLVGPTLDVNE